MELRTSGFLEFIYRQRLNLAIKFSLTLSPQQPYALLSRLERVAANASLNSDLRYKCSTFVELLRIPKV